VVLAGRLANNANRSIALDSLRFPQDRLVTDLYSPDDYDANFALRPSVAMILAMLYAARHLVLIFLAYFPGMAGSTGGTFIKEMLSPFLVASDVPALVLLLAWRFRAPEAGWFWRAIWRHGRALLVLTLVAQFALLATMHWGPMLMEAPRTRGNVIVVSYALLHLYVLGYVLMADRVKAVFKDFPKPTEPTPAA
jgi:hypothetical protein